MNKFVVLKNYAIINNQLVRKNVNAEKQLDAPSCSQTDTNRDILTSPSTSPANPNSQSISNTFEDVEESSGEGENLQNEIIQLNDDHMKYWDHKSTMLFLDEFARENPNFRNPKVKKRNIWERISMRMIMYGYKVDANMLDQKLRNMKSTYNKIKDNKKSTKTGRGRTNWQYFDRMEEIFINDKTVHLPNVVQTLEGTPNQSNNVSEEPSQSTITIDDSDTSTASNTKKKNLDALRKRQLEIEQERVDELKKIRLAIEENNRLSKEKLTVLTQYLSRN
ncbi:hypothetical protein FQR65_LT05341 [Abscondita terminalis]|nr:hypothetical protein FQR65_LT05341 [Abscondita terminalis]